MAGNDHFAEMFGITERTVQRVIKSLKDKSLVEVAVKKSDDTRVLRVLGRFARLSNQDVTKLSVLKAELVRKLTHHTLRSTY